MRQKSEYAGRALKIKNNVGRGMNGQLLEGEHFIVEDWCENVLGRSWMSADGNPAALEYAIRTAINGKNNNVPKYSDDVLYGKVGYNGHLFHINELEIENAKAVNTEEKSIMDDVKQVFEKFQEYKKRAEQSQFPLILFYDMQITPAYLDLCENFNEEHARIFTHALKNIVFPKLGIG
jgi:hypothetical protein